MMISFMMEKNTIKIHQSEPLSEDLYFFFVSVRGERKRVY